MCCSKESLTPTFGIENVVYTNITSCSGCPEDLSRQHSVSVAEYIGCTTVSWISLVGQEYLILVAKDYEDTTANFQFPLSANISVHNNDRCNFAYQPISIQWPKEIYTGSLLNARINGNVSSCGATSVSELPGVWYKIDGADGVIIASTCTGTVVDTSISVFRGECDQLECIDSNDNGCGENRPQSAVSWNSEEGVTYFILVSGDGDLDGTGASFSLTIENLASSNDKCSNAIQLDSPAIGVTFVFDLASFSPARDTEVLNVTSCFPPVSDPKGDGYRGHWYSVMGRGGTYQVSVRSKDPIEDAFPPFVTVFEGSCNNLACASYDSGELAQWLAEEGTMYLIYVFLTDDSDKWSDKFEIVLEQRS
jgi:hypothetical protein